MRFAKILSLSVLTLTVVLSSWFSLRVYSQDTNVAGYAVISPDNDTVAPTASALFTLRNADQQLIAEAAVEAVQPVQSGRIFIDQRGSQTGLALVNSGSDTVRATLVLRDSAGNQVAQNQLEIQAGNHLARFVDQLFAISPNFIGSLTFTCQSGALAGVTLRQSLNAHNELILAALPLVVVPQVTAELFSNQPLRQVAPQGSAESLVFGHIGAGDAGSFGLSTEIVLISTSNLPASGQIEFFSSNGQPLEIEDPGPQGSSSTVPFELSGHGVFSLRIERSGAPVQGYAVLTNESGELPAGTALFQFRTPSGALLSEAGVAGMPALNRAQLFVDTAATQTGLAVANPEGQELSLQLILKDLHGRTIETRELEVPANGHLSAFVDQLFESLPPGFTGTLELSSPEPVVVVSLKLTFNERNDPILTTLPVSNLSQALAGGIWILPQIGFGPNITTRILLLGNAEDSSLGQLSFLLSDGSPMSVPLLGDLATGSSYEVSPQGAGQLRLGNRARASQIRLQNRIMGGEIALNQGSTLILRPGVVDETGSLRDDFPVVFTSLDPEVVTLGNGGRLDALKPGFSTISIQVGELLETLTVSVADLSSSAAGFQIEGLITDASQRLFVAAPQNQVLFQLENVDAVAEIYAGQNGQSGLLDGLRESALFRNPSHLAVDQARGQIMVSDQFNHAIRTVGPGPRGEVTTLAGGGQPGSEDGIGSLARFQAPTGIALDSQGQLWIADTGNHTIRRLNPATLQVITVAGLAGIPGAVDGVGIEARFNSPLGLAAVPETLAQQLARAASGVPPPEIAILVADSGNGTIRRVFESGRVETVLAETTPSGSLDDLREPVAVGADKLGNVFFADRTSGSIQTILPDGTVTSALEPGTLVDPRALAIPIAGQLLASGSAGLSQLTFGSPTIGSISPERVADGGGDEVTIAGTNLAAGTQVVIAGTLIENVSVEDTGTLRLELPPLDSGLALVSVFNRGGLAQSSLLVEPVPLDDLEIGIVTTIAGGTTFEGEGQLAINVPMRPVSLAIDNTGSLLVADSQNNRIRRFDGNSGRTITTAGTGRAGFLGDGLVATAADLDHPTGILLDPEGNLWIADSGRGFLRRVDVATGILTTIAGGGQNCFDGVENGPARTACIIFNESVGLAFEPQTPTLFFSETEQDQTPASVRGIDLSSGIIFTLAGGGQPADGVGDGPDATQANLAGPVGLAYQDRELYVAEYEGHRVRRIRTDTGAIETIAGSGIAGFFGDGGPALEAQLDEPAGLAFDLDGNLLIADSANTRIRRLNIQTGIIDTIAGDGRFDDFLDGSPALETSFTDPVALQVDGAGNLYVADSDLLQVFRIDSRTGTVTSVGGNGALTTHRDGPAFAATLESPESLAVDHRDNLYVSDSTSGLLRRIDSQFVLETIAGGGEDEAGQLGLASEAQFCSLGGLAIDPSGNIYLADACNYQVRRILIDTGLIEDVAGVRQLKGFAGDGGPALDALLVHPVDVGFDSSGNLLIVDSKLPEGDPGEGNRIRRVDLTTGIIDTLVGDGELGSDGDGGPAILASLAGPVSVVGDSMGNVYISQLAEGLERIRRIAPDGTISTFAGSEGDVVDGVVATESAVFASQLAVDGTYLYLAGSTSVRRIDLSTQIIETVAGDPFNSDQGFGDRGDGKPALEARFPDLRAIALDSNGNIFLGDITDRRIRAIRGPIP